MLLIAASAALLGGCGPFGYLGKVSRDATKAVADAKQAGAEQYAPYEYWGAVTYLEQAKILMAYSEYERSFDYGERAQQLAEEAKRKADKREAGEMTETLESEGVTGGEPDAPSASGNADAANGEAKASGSLRWRSHEERRRSNRLRPEASLALEGRAPEARAEA